MEQKTKLIQALQATRGYQNLTILSNSMRYEFFLLGIFLA